MFYKLLILSTCYTTELPPMASVGVTPFCALVSGRPSIFGLRVYVNRTALRLVRKTVQNTTNMAVVESLARGELAMDWTKPNFNFVKSANFPLGKRENPPRI